MAHKTKPAAQARPFADRAQHFERTAQGIDAEKRRAASDRATVRTLLQAAVKAGSAQ